MLIVPYCTQVVAVNAWSILVDYLRRVACAFLDICYRFGWIYSGLKYTNIQPLLRSYGSCGQPFLLSFCVTKNCESSRLCAYNCVQNLMHCTLYYCLPVCSLSACACNNSSLLQGALELREKRVEDIMTPVDSAFMLEVDTELDLDVLNQVSNK